MNKLNENTLTERARRHTRTRKRLYVLIACEESQAECSAFRRLGHTAFSCDIQPCKPHGHKEWHIQGDVTPYLDGTTHFVTMDGHRHWVPKWDLIIAHPPCTYLCKVGSLWLYNNPSKWCTVDHQRLYVNAERWQAMKDARAFFFRCLNANAPYVAVENPIPMRIAQLPRPSFYACPSWFGCRYTKKTLYWVRNLPPLMATIDHSHPREFVRASRGKYRSWTFTQLANAIAKQWSSYILDELAKDSEKMICTSQVK